MGDNEGKEEPPARGWEVVPLTESTYAAAPDRKKVEKNDYEVNNIVGQDGAGTSRTMFISGYCIFPPSQHENLPLEPETDSIVSVREAVDTSDDADEIQEFGSALVEDEGIRSKVHDQNKINVASYPIPIFDEEGNILSVDESEFAEPDRLLGSRLTNETKDFYSSEQLNSWQSELREYSAAENLGFSEVTESRDRGLDLSISSMPNPDKDCNECNLPCGAWWKRRAASLYAQSKVSNCWSICIAAAVMGLVIIGQRWQHERGQLLQLRWQASLYDEKVGRMLGPLTRFKDMLLSGQRSGSLVSTPGDH